MTTRSFLLAVALIGMSCSQSNTLPQVTSGERIVVTITGGTLGTTQTPNTINFDPLDSYTVHLEMHDASDQLDTNFNKWVRISSKPGTVYSIGGPDPSLISGRNVKMVNGVADGVTVTIVAAFGETRIWAQDLGYVPVDPTSTQIPECSNNIDDDGDNLIDYPADPGCYAPNDDDETSGTGATGVSDVIYYARPRIADVRGAFTDQGTGTPFPNEQVDIDTGYDLATNVFEWDTIVTGLSSSGFFATDLQDAQGDPEAGLGYGSVFAYTFSAPTKIGVCDRIRLLQGTSSDFFGYTELNFPTWAVEYWEPSSRPCLVPDPVVLAPADVTNTSLLFKYEAGLVRVAADTTNNVTIHVGAHFGANKPTQASGFTPTNAATNCDLNGNGKVDFSDPNEAACSDACTADAECSEFSAYESEGNFTIVVTNGTTTSKAQGQAAAATSFDPVAYVEQANATSGVATLTSFTGNLTYFSGGSQFTIQARCDDDVRYKTGDQPLDSYHSCVNQNGNNPDQQN
jgi:hypothetical protein